MGNGGRGGRGVCSEESQVAAVNAAAFGEIRPFFSGLLAMGQRWDMLYREQLSAILVLRVVVLSCDMIPAAVELLMVYLQQLRGKRGGRRREKATLQKRKRKKKALPRLQKRSKHRVNGFQGAGLVSQACVPNAVLPVGCRCVAAGVGLGLAASFLQVVGECSGSSLRPCIFWSPVSQGVVQRPS